jgi:uncharacterized protein
MAWFLQGARVQGESPIAVIKLWLYAAVSVAAGAWITPLLYNAGKALAEVSARKTTNGALEWLAKRCESAELPSFFGGSVLLVAAVLFFPWMEWIYSRSKTRGPSVGSWFLEVPGFDGLDSNKSRLLRHRDGLRDACCGFLVVAGLVFVMSLTLVATTSLLLHPFPSAGWCLRMAGSAVLLAYLMEVFFRSIALGMFMRVMKPAAAWGMSAGFFALLLACIPPPGLIVADPDASGTGFELLGLIIRSYADVGNLLGTIIPLLALGGVLGYARLKSTSLWLPTGLHAGLIFSMNVSGYLIIPQGKGTSARIAVLVQEDLIPFSAIVLAGWLVHRQFSHADASTSPQAA